MVLLRAQYGGCALPMMTMNEPTEIVCKELLVLHLFQMVSVESIEFDGARNIVSIVIIFKRGLTISETLFG